MISGWIHIGMARDLPAMYWHFLYRKQPDGVFRRSFCGWLWEVLSVLWGEYLYATENIEDIGWYFVIWSSCNAGLHRAAVDAVIYRSLFLLSHG